MCVNTQFLHENRVTLRHISSDFQLYVHVHVADRVFVHVSVRSMSEQGIPQFLATS